MTAATVPIETSGLGVILYSPWAVAGIQQGEAYLKARYWETQHVLQHVYEGGLVGFGTGSPGSYVLEIRSGGPDEARLDKALFKLRLGIQIRDGALCLRDLYDLMEWDSKCPPSQRLRMEDGIYRITVYSDLPPSGIKGDGQVIWMYFEKVQAMPALKYSGMPSLT